MQTTATRTAGSHTDLLTGILNVQVRNEDKITEQDRQYCQLQQDQLYRTLDRIDRWYDIFKEEAERYREIKSFKYEDNGKVSIRNFYFNNSGEDDYTHNEFKPFDLINELADNNCNANAIEHLGGKSFRETAEEELLARFLKTVQPSRWSKVKPELKKDKITFPDIVSWDSIHLEYHREYEFSYDCGRKVDIFCEGIAYGADDVINGSSGMVIGLDRRDVDIADQVLQERTHRRALQRQPGRRELLQETAAG